MARSDAPKRPSDEPRIRQVDNDDSAITAPLLSDNSQNPDDAQHLPRKPSWDGLAEFEHLPWYRRPSLYWLLFAFPIFTLAFGGIMVPKLNLTLSLVCEKYLSEQTDIPHSITAVDDNPICRSDPKIQKLASTFMLVMNFTTGLLSAFVAPRLGALSDRYGRTRLLAFSSCGGLMAEAITVVIAKYPDVFDYKWLVLGSVFDGLTGSFTSGSVLAQSYISDCTSPSRRAVAIGWIQACIFGGIAFGPLLAGYLVEYTGSLLSIFYVALVCHSTFILFVRFIVPDSLSKARKQEAQDKYKKEKRREEEVHGKRSGIENPLKPLAILWPKAPGVARQVRYNLVLLVVSDTVIMMSSLGAGATIILYSGHIFDWKTLQSSKFISALSMVRVFSLLLVLPAINYFGRIRPAAKLRRESGQIPIDRNHGADRLDLVVLRLALLSDLIGVLGYIFSRDGRLFFLSGMLTALGGLGTATTQSVVTKLVPRHKVGSVMGALGMCMAISRVTGPIMFSGMYSLTVETYPQASFVLLASMFVIAIIAASFVKPYVHWEEAEQDDEPEFAYPADVAYSDGVPPPPPEEDPLIVR